MAIPIPSRAWRPAAAALLPFLAGCLSVGPDFQAPEWDGPEAWSATNAPVASPLPDGAPWWSVFGDPVLDSLEAELLEQNLSLAAAVARLDSAAAQLGATRAGLAPSADLSASAAYDRQSGEVHGSGAKVPDNPDWLFRPGVSFSWELDFWGRVRRSVEAASADLDSAAQNVRDSRRLLAARLASSYLSLRTLQTRLDFARRNAPLQADTLELVKARRDAGLNGDLDLRQAEMNLASTRAGIAPLEAQIDSALNSICTLLGRRRVRDGALRPPPRGGRIGRPPRRHDRRRRGRRALRLPVPLRPDGLPERPRHAAPARVQPRRPREGHRLRRLGPRRRLEGLRRPRHAESGRDGRNSRRERGSLTLSTNSHCLQ